jgi:hypothetical protein
MFTVIVPIEVKGSYEVLFYFNRLERERKTEKTAAASNKMMDQSRCNYKEQV